MEALPIRRGVAVDAMEASPSIRCGACGRDPPPWRPHRRSVAGAVEEGGGARGRRPSLEDDSNLLPAMLRLASRRQQSSSSLMQTRVELLCSQRQPDPAGRSDLVEEAAGEEVSRGGRRRRHIGGWDEGSDVGRLLEVLIFLSVTSFSLLFSYDDFAEGDRPYC